MTDENNPKPECGHECCGNCNVPPEYQDGEPTEQPDEDSEEEE